MKVQKIVSLDPETAELAQRMNNFSAFVRQSLRAQAVDSDLASEYTRRVRWTRTAHTLAELCIGYAKALDPDFDKGAEDLVIEVMNQTLLEDFE